MRWRGAVCFIGCARACRSSPKATGDSLFIVLSGPLRAFSNGSDEREVTYAIHGPGEYVGEMGLDGGLRSANVQTLQASVCALVTRATLERHLAEDPAFAFELLAKVIRRARAATLGLRQIALLDVYGRLTALLEDLALPAPNGERLVDPAPSHLEISRLLGSSREMVSKVTKDLERGGYVRVGRRAGSLRRGAAGRRPAAPFSGPQPGGGPTFLPAFAARSYSGITFGNLAWMSRIRVSPAGWVDKNCGGAPLDAAIIFCHSVTPAAGL